MWVASLRDDQFSVGRICLGGGSPEMGRWDPTKEQRPSGLGGSEPDLAPLLPSGGP